MRVAGDFEKMWAGLLGRDDGILAGLGHAKLYDGLCLDLDRFTGCGIAAEAGLARHFHELAETGHCELTLFPGFLVGDVRERVQKIAYVLFGDAELFRNFADQLCFRECFRGSMSVLAQESEQKSTVRHSPIAVRRF